MVKIETYIDKQKKNVYKGKAHHVINIKKNKSDTSRGSSDEESSVIRTQSETLLSNN